jgi:hypothetical protein
VPHSDVDGYLHPLFSSDRIGRDNLSRFSDPDVDRALDRVAREAEDDEDRASATPRDRAAVRALPMAPLTTSLSRWLVDERVGSASGQVVDGSTGRCRCASCTCADSRRLGGGTAARTRGAGPHPHARAPAPPAVVPPHGLVERGDAAGQRRARRVPRSASRRAPARRQLPRTSSPRCRPGCPARPGAAARTRPREVLRAVGARGQRRHGGARHPRRRGSPQQREPAAAPPRAAHERRARDARVTAGRTP